MKPTYRTLVISLMPLLVSAVTAAESDTTVAAAETTPATQASRAPDPESKNRSISWRASEILGTNVKNTKDETVGEIEDLIVEWKSSEVVAVVISTGGFLGVADTLSSVALSQLKYDPVAKVFHTSLTKADFEKQPRFKSDAWPDLNDAAVLSRWREMRDPTSGGVTAPESTPMDQGTDESDVKLTKDIRSSVMDAELSYDAKNIKIITNGGRVVLRGEVQNEQEHQAVLNIAQKHANAMKITDEIKVKSK
jgi:sporulation protein YlmC with PRC-barrel domain